MEFIIYLVFAFFIGYGIGKIKGSDDIFQEWDKYIRDHTVYNTVTNNYEIK